jgi:GNAT superfamily N-acetyltransferase
MARGALPPTGGASSLTAALEPWMKFSRDPALPTLFLSYSEEFNTRCNPDWSRAHRMALVDELHAFALRDRGTMVGFCLVRMWPQLPFKDRMVAFASEIFVDPTYRGIGTKMLLAEVMKVMRTKGAVRFALHHAQEDPAVFPPLDATGIAMRLWGKDL